MRNCAPVFWIVLLPHLHSRGVSHLFAFWPTAHRSPENVWYARIPIQPSLVSMIQTLLMGLWGYRTQNVRKCCTVASFWIFWKMNILYSTKNIPYMTSLSLTHSTVNSIRYPQEYCAPVLQVFLPGKPSEVNVSDWKTVPTQLTTDLNIGGNCSQCLLWLWHVPQMNFFRSNHL